MKDNVVPITEEFEIKELIEECLNTAMKLEHTFEKGFKLFSEKITDLSEDQERENYLMRKSFYAAFSLIGDCLYIQSRLLDRILTIEKSL